MEKKKKQSVSFRDMDEFLAYLPEDELRIVHILRDAVFDCAPHAKEKLSYNVPYYFLNTRFCFIWPASILWGKEKTYNGVRFGFTKGYLMQDAHQFLDKSNRKQVYWRDFISIKKNELQILKEYIHEAIILDQLPNK